ncbi:hypothetical protein HMPREF0178_00710 [Bilophila sp. 4_1_30]|nr:hypothetical protein HMPREF0178_00710 [Bilophila sp. 4_1_30]
MSVIKPYPKTLSQPSQLSHCHMYQQFSVGQSAKTKLSQILADGRPSLWDSGTVGTF